MTTLTRIERERLVTQLRELDAQDQSIIYRDALDQRTSGQIQHGLDQLWGCYAAIETQLRKDAAPVLAKYAGLPEIVLECAGIAVDPESFIQGWQQGEYEQWCERDHP